MTTHNVKLTGKHQIADGTMEFRFEKPKGFKFRAGQFLDIILRGKNDAPKRDYIHGFSIVAAPFEDYLAIATRMRGSPFKESLKNLANGSEVQIDASYGNFTLPKESDKTIVFIIGGIGVTPVRSMIAQATHDQSDHRLILIHANKTPSNAPFAEDFRHFARANHDFTFIPAYSESSAHSEVSDGETEAETGMVDAAMIRRHVPDIPDSVFYLSGPPGMVRAMRSILMDELEVDEDNIRTEEFDGY